MDPAKPRGVHKASGGIGQHAASAHLVPTKACLGVLPFLISTLALGCMQVEAIYRCFGGCLT